MKSCLLYFKNLVCTLKLYHWFHTVHFSLYLCIFKFINKFCFPIFQVPKDSDESSDEEADPDAEREPNKFDNLTDGVVNTMALVQTALQEVHINIYIRFSFSSST